MLAAHTQSMSTNVVEVTRLEDVDYYELRAIRESLIAGTLRFRFTKSDYFRPYHRYYTVAVQAPEGRLVTVGWVVGDTTDTRVDDRPVWVAFKQRIGGGIGVEVNGGWKRQDAADEIVWSATR